MFNNHRIARRAGIVIALTVALALAFALLLAFLKFDQKLLDVSIARMSIVADNVRDQGQTVLNLGLELVELHDMTGVIKRESQASGVVRIDVQSNDGTVLYSTDESMIGHHMTLPELRRTADGRFRQRVEENQLIIVADLTDSLAHDTGDVVLYATVASTRATLDTVRNQLLLMMVPVILIAMGVTLFAVSFTVGRLTAPSTKAGETMLAISNRSEHLYQTLEPRLLRAAAAAAAKIKAVANSQQ